MAFCIVPELAEKLKKAAIDGSIDVAKMFEMDSTGRKAIFEKYADKETARQINLGFEKAMVSSQKNALANWVKRTFTPEDVAKGKVQDAVKQIEGLQEVLNSANSKNFLEDLVAEKLGVRVTAEEAKTIAGKTEKIAANLKEMGDDFGNPIAKTDSQLKYAKAREEMDNYIKSLSPQPKLRVLSSVISRANMLTRFGSAVVNVVSNSVQGVTQSLVRRLVTKRLGGANADLISKYIANNMDIFRQSGFDPSRMLTMEAEKVIKGERITHSQGKGIIRGVGKLAEKYVFRYTQGLPDVLYSSAAFADRANIESTKIAAQMGLKGVDKKLKAREIMLDSMRVEPKTKEGIAVRNNGIADAMYSTGTHNSNVAQAALSIRDAMNKLTGDIRAGDQITPFVKTPANFIQIGIEHSGLTVIPSAGLRIWKAISDAKVTGSFNESLAENFAGYGQVLARAGVGITFAAALSTLFSPDDFMGEYPTTQKDRDLMKLKGATPNSVRIGNHWISLDYFGTLAPAMAGFLYARKYGKDLPNAIFQYALHNATQAARVPGFEDFSNFVTNLKQSAANGNITLEDAQKEAGTYAMTFLSSRTLPGIIYDFSKATDPLERRVDKNDIYTGFEQAIPTLRQNLPADTNAFGENRNTEGWNVLLFGSRVKTAKDDSVISELSRLQSTGNLPSVTDVSYTSQKAKDLKTQIGDQKFSQFLSDYGSAFKSGINDLLADSDYQDATDEDKAKEIDKLKNATFNEYLDTYGYEKKEKAK